MFGESNRTLVKIVEVIGVIVVAGILAFFLSSYRLYVIHTGSMQATIPSRSAVVVKRGPVHVGEVISFHHNGEVVTHRLIAVNRDGTLVTKGDSNDTPDAVPTPRDQVVGHVVFAPRGVGYWLYWLKGSGGLSTVILLILAAFFTFLAAKPSRKPLAPDPPHTVA